MKKIDRVKNEINKMIDGKSLHDEELVKVSQLLDKILIEHIRTENCKMPVKNADYELEFKEFIDILPCAIYVIKDSIIIDCNMAALELLGYDKKEELIGFMPYELSPQYQDDGTHSIIKGQQFIDSAHDNSILNFLWKHKRKNGEVFLSDIKIHNKNNILYAIVTDTSENSKTKETLNNKDILYQMLFENHDSVMLVTNPETGKIVEANYAAIQYYGYTKENILKMHINEINTSSEDEIRNEKALALREKRNFFHFTHRLADNTQREVEVHSFPVATNAGKLLFSVISDIDEKKKIYKRMMELQQRDSLTGLYNRIYFLTMLDKYIKDYKYNKEKFSIIVIDIEAFKDINDSVGHITGDKLLKEISNRINELMTEEQVVSRVDGDEFAILCNTILKSGLKSLTKRLLYKLNQPYNISSSLIYLNFNIGICIYPKDGNDSEELLRYANAAIYKSKKKSDNRICFYSREISKEIEQKFFLANYLFGALTNKELSVYYQPIFDINEKRLVGAEALLRWDSPILGQVSPEEFIPIAEKTGQIIAIGEWVIDEVCKQISIWQKKNYVVIPVSVNVSVKQLEQINFANTLLTHIKNSHIKPEYIEIEITESVSSGDIKKIIKNIKKLKINGMKISMDDFGTGFSSLGQLNIFQLDKLKIDKIFVNDLVNGLKRQNLVKSIIAMANSLNLITVAEGIETNEQLYQLKELGCKLGQGYIFSRPLCVADIEVMLTQIIS
jgi:diguanylate cyclase (GGDEF)-like protein/PAS domain S-box-containing protein